MGNLPEQVHGGALSAVVDNPYALSADDITIPRLRLAQYSSAAVKSRLVDFGDLYVGIGKEDANPTVVAKAGAPLGEPLRFYIHRLTAGFNYKDRENETQFGPRGASYREVLQLADGDPRRVFQKHDYLLTVPSYPRLPVLFLMTSKWGGHSAKWINTQIGIAVQEGQNPLGIAFQIQTRQVDHPKGGFAEAVVQLADVKAKDAKSDAELVAKQAEIASSAQRYDADESDVATATVVDAPSLG
jgi:hypothetical protein